MGILLCLSIFIVLSPSNSIHLVNGWPPQYFTLNPKYKSHFRREKEVVDVFFLYDEVIVRWYIRFSFGF